MRLLSIVTALLALSASARAQSTDADDVFDACGVLVSGGGCILFEGGGGSYALPGGGGFAFGDQVRVVGSLDENCTFGCPDADGCIRGPEYYDPAVFPCGTDLPNFPGDIITNACNAATLALLTLACAGLWLNRRTTH